MRKVQKLACMIICVMVVVTALPAAYATKNYNKNINNKTSTRLELDSSKTGRMVTIYVWPLETAEIKLIGKNGTTVVYEGTIPPGESKIWCGDDVKYVELKVQNPNNADRSDFAINLTEGKSVTAVKFPEPGKLGKDACCEFTVEPGKNYDISIINHNQKSKNNIFTYNEKGTNLLRRNDIIGNSGIERFTIPPDVTKIRICMTRGGGIVAITKTEDEGKTLAVKPKPMKQPAAPQVIALDDEQIDDPDTNVHYPPVSDSEPQGIYCSLFFGGVCPCTPENCRCSPDCPCKR